MQTQRIRSVKRLGVHNTLDFKVDHKDHNFYAEGIVVSNSHSVAYATMCAATAYLKFKYPKEFFLSLLRLSQDEPDPMFEVSKIYKEIPYFNVKLLSPHILKSGNDYEIEGDNIRMGLNSVKSISEKALDKLHNFKNKYSSKFEIFRAANAAGLNISIVGNLIWVGSLDDMLTETRAKTQMEFIFWNLLTDNEKIWASKLEKEYNSDLIQIIIDLNEKLKNEKGKPIIKDSRRLTIRKGFKPYKELYNYNRKNPEIFSYIAERDLLGFAYSTTLFNIYKDKVDNLSPISEIMSDIQGSKHTFVCEVKYAHLGSSKVKKTPYMKLDVKDDAGELRVMIFNGIDNPKLDQCKELNNGLLPKEKDIVIVTGKKMDGNTIFADRVTIQDVEIYLRVSKMPKNNKNAPNSLT